MILFRNGTSQHRRERIWGIHSGTNHDPGDILPSPFLLILHMLSLHKEKIRIVIMVLGLMMDSYITYFNFRLNEWKHLYERETCGWRRESLVGLPRVWDANLNCNRRSKTPNHPWTSTWIIWVVHLHLLRQSRTETWPTLEIHPPSLLHFVTKSRPMRVIVDSAEIPGLTCRDEAGSWGTVDCIQVTMLAWVTSYDENS